MRRAFWSTRLHHTFPFRIITDSAISRGTSGWGCRVAFPWRKVFDIFQRRGSHDPIESLRNGYHPHVAHGCKFFEEGHRSCHEHKCKMRAISGVHFTLKLFPLSQIPSENDFSKLQVKWKLVWKKIPRCSTERGEVRLFVQVIGRFEKSEFHNKLIATRNWKEHWSESVSWF